MSHTLGTRTLRGMLWAYGSYVGGRALVLVSTAILARLLNPADFGLVALALIFTALLESVARSSAACWVRPRSASTRSDSGSPS